MVACRLCLVSTIIMATVLTGDAVDCDKVWKVGAKMPGALGEVTAGSIGGKIYVAGQGNKATYVYDVKANKWSTTTARMFVGNHHSAVTYQGKWYLIGGLDGGSETKVQIFNPASKKWTAGANMPFISGSPSTGIFKGKVLTCGGIDESKPAKKQTSRTCSVYDIKQNKWNTMPIRMIRSQNHAAHCMQGSNLIILGGRQGGNTLGPSNATSQKATVPAGKFSSLPSLPVPLAGGGQCVSAQGALWVFGGEYNGKDCVQYGKRAGVFGKCTSVGGTLAGGQMLKGGQWLPLPAMPSGRHGIFPIAVDGKVYIIGGGSKPGRSASQTVFYASLTDLEACAGPEAD